ncbi:unnamed protein product [Blepharisma stoltei]|uniref:Uncharacterized protein n=1 Tax=Blepharisma stoltei TaxID=1481888 RepID=A0AAU9JP24_9CILI|nr:unnamed protein product [Blepharisma stoltei]
MQMMRLFLLLFTVVFSQTLVENLFQKIEKTKGKITIEAGAALVNLNDDELDFLLYNSEEDWVILFYDSSEKSAFSVSSTWNLAARYIKYEGYNVTFGKVDIKNYSKNFKRLRLYNHPSAVYVTHGTYYNLTMGFEMEEVLSMIRNQTYLAYPNKELPISTHGVLGLMSYFYVWHFLSGFAISIFLTLGASKFLKMLKKPKAKKNI